MKPVNKRHRETPHLHKFGGWWFCECTVATGIGSTPRIAFRSWYQWRIVKQGRE